MGGRQMDFEKFAEIIQAYIEKRVKKTASVMIKKVLKNNSFTLTGLIIMEPDSNVSPTIYLEAYWEQYLAGSKLTDIAESILREYANSQKYNHMDLGYLKLWEKVKNKVVYKLINTERNSEFLKGVPHQNIMDLSMVFYLGVEKIEGIVSVTNKLFDAWGISLDELTEAAKVNTPKILPLKIKLMTDFIWSTLNPQEILDSGVKKMPKMYILSNDYRKFGAAAMLYPESLKVIANTLESDMYILPSSIHECIILSVPDGWDVVELSDMVKSVNTILLPEEILSENVYIYKWEEDELDIAY